MQPDRLEELLRAERQSGPDPGAEDRIWAAVEHRLLHGPPPPAGAEVAAAATGGTALKLLAGLALVVTAVGVLAARGPGEPAPPAPVVERVAAAAIEHVPTDSRVAAPVGLEVETVVAAPEEAPAPEEEPVAAKPKPRARPRALAPADPPGEADDFAAELQLIAEIRGALKRGDSARALERVGEHARRFGARGQLVQERLAYHVDALCAAGRVDEARRVAGDLLSRWPDSTHAPRVKKGCAGA